MLFVLFPIGGHGARSVVHAVVLCDNDAEERPVVLSLRSKAMAAAAIFHRIVRDVGCDSSVGM